MKSRISLSHPLFHNVHKKFVPIIKSKKTASYLTLTLSLISLSFFGLFAIRPTLVTAFTLYKSVADLRKLNIDYENKIGNLIRAQSEFEQIRDDLPLIDAAIPFNTDFTKLAKTVEKFAETENIKIEQMQIDDVSISKITSTGQLNHFGFSLVGTGNYSSITSFIARLLNSKRIININSLEISRESGSGSANLNINIKAATHYEP